MRILRNEALPGGSYLVRDSETTYESQYDGHGGDVGKLLMKPFFYLRLALLHLRFSYAVRAICQRQVAASEFAPLQNLRCGSQVGRPTILHLLAIEIQEDTGNHNVLCG